MTFSKFTQFHYAIEPTERIRMSVPVPVPVVSRFRSLLEANSYITSPKIITKATRRKDDIF